MEPIFLSRYPEDKIAVSGLDHLEDSLDVAAFLCATDFIVQNLIDHHGKTEAQAKKLAPRIAAHAKMAGQYSELAIVSRPEVSFLPAYYAVLNIAKVYCLAGSFSNEFSAHTRWHGATYDAHGKASQSILTEKVRVRGGGALALFYKTLTGSAIAGDHLFSMRDIYPVVHGIASELDVVTGKSSPRWGIQFSGERAGTKIKLEAEVFTVDNNNKRQHYRGAARRIPAIQAFQKKPNANGFFRASVTDTGARSIDAVARDIVRTEFLGFRPEGCYDYCIEQSSALPLTEEFAAALAFFHLSSVCRYNPELMLKFSSSRAWPMLLSLRRHTLSDCLQKCWSFIVKRNYHLQSPSYS